MLEQTVCRVQPGEMWQIGPHRIACIDATDRATVLALVGTDRPTFVWSDPPYGISIVDVRTAADGGGAVYAIPFGGVQNRPAVATDGGNGRDKPYGSAAARATVGGSGRNGIVKQGLYAPVIGDDSPATAIAGYRLCADLWPKARQIWWGANNYAHALPPTTCWIVWDKQNTGGFADAELAWCNSKTAVRIFQHKWNGMIKASERGCKRVHPTQKPIALAEWAFTKYGKPGDVIFDPFLGSGISLLAAARFDDERRVIGCELSPEYCDVIIRRCEQAGIGPIYRLSPAQEHAA